MTLHWVRLGNLNRASTLPQFNFWGRHQCKFLNDRMFSTLKVNLSKVPQEILSANKKISELIRSGKLEDARTLFDKLSQRNTVTWNSMLSGYVKRREIAKARRFFDEMPEKDVVSWNLIVSGYVSCRGRRYVEEGRYLFDKMPERDFVSWNTMISGYAKNGRMDDALRLFNSMPEKNVVSWNAMITGFLNNGNVKTACELFKKMPTRDAASLSGLVSGLIQNDDIDEAEKILFEYGKMGDGKEDSIHAYNTLIAGYGQKCRVEDARRIFNQIPVDGFKRNLVSCNSMIMSYVKAGDMASARDLFNQMGNRDDFSWNTLISGYVHASDLEEATKLFVEMQSPDVLSWNSIISGFTQAGKMEIALDFFKRMPQKNRVSWNTIIAGYEKNGGFQEAIKFFVHMQAEGEKPDRHTLSSLLSICAESAARHLGMQIHQLVTKIVIPDVPLNNSLITMYARCGAISEAKTVFNEMKYQKDVISWNAMIGGYASHGFAKKALEVFESMKGYGVKPTYITFISVLSACAHGGLVEEGKSYFRSMVCDFGIEPRVEHFASLVDVVGRYGKVEEAMEIINQMPIEPDKAVWGALLGGCRVHNNVEMARVAAETLMKLEPESSGPYVLLYNMYADVGRWNDADEIRMLMDKNNVRKEGGYSRIFLHVYYMGCQISTESGIVVTRNEQNHSGGSPSGHCVSTCASHLRWLDAFVTISSYKTVAMEDEIALCLHVCIPFEMARYIRDNIIVQGSGHGRRNPPRSKAIKAQYLPRSSIGGAPAADNRLSWRRVSLQHSIQKPEFPYLLNHNHGRRHNFFPNHKSSLSTLLTRFQSKLADVKFFLKTPILLRPEHAHQNRLWCVFCNCDILELDSRFACGDAIEHLASGEHWKRVKGFMWKYGGGMDRVDLFRVTEEDYAKWEKKCKLLKAEAARVEPVGPSNNIHNEMNADNVNSFHKNSVNSLNFNIPNGVVPLHSYTDERTQVSGSVLSSISKAGPSFHNMTWGVQVGDAQTTGCMDNQNSSNSLARECSSYGHLSNGSVQSGVRTANGESRSLGMQILTQISSTSQQAIQGNVHTGAPPPWFDATKGSQLDLTCKPEVSDLASSKAGKSSKLNPKRVGAAWAERRKLELESERRGELVNNNFDANWLPNFGRVWQSGTRKESRKAFQMESKSSPKCDNQSDELMPLQPYVSKRMVKFASPYVVSVFFIFYTPVGKM
ncbi:hypothetical protein BUALT_Bualt02G0132200 [Buddleja alternifolia]|uniref:Pentatricopeptide repeat-containing protein n=1 Tax=Buddleja alternifolia TaxID=168488 RepID=A0AAV6Y6L3_9LAMI|nr:hypothetical protein BUALT_Bualt02G0132200 [Buddleja alternifolia]